MSDKFEPSKIEEKYYKIWEERGYFEIDGNKQIQEKDKTFALMMPPPNVTGVLHIGHALTFTLQDIIIRYKRMDGYKTLWQAGMDHAGIATQNVVEKQLLAKGQTKEELGREKFLEKVWEWKEFSGGSINHQMRKLGISPAWSRERFTMDEGLKQAVKEAFVKLFDEGLIEQNNYMVNWCTHDGALSDIEVEHEEIQGHFYHMRYYFPDSDEFIVVATTRPETYFGDSAIMVHPEDTRYKHLIGKEVCLPLVGKRLKIIADKYVDMDFGTGIVKVTPAHDPNDYEVGLRHKLEFISVFDKKGILNNHCLDFEGLERLEAREKIVTRLKEKGFIEKIEEHKHQVGHCYRCKNIVEPYISKQWFVKKEVAKKSIEKTYKGLTQFFPAHWLNSYRAWMDELRPWCISRQLWWGHRIPVFTCKSCSHQWADKQENPKSCPKCNKNNIIQDPDVLDTWFSSALWSFSTLGWGNNNTMQNTYTKDDLKDFYPNALLITGFDIMFFWVARMMMMGEHFMGELPFKHIYMHALVRDEHGAKMSKSKGNVINPLDVVEEFSADIVRFSLAYLCVQGRDIKLGKKHLEIYRNFTNKLYNAVNFLQLNQEVFPNLDEIELKTPLGIYMQTRLSFALEEIRSSLDTYKFNDAAAVMYKFIWNEFCDWGIEYSKVDTNSINELGAIFKETLKMSSLFMPFISEYLFQKLNGTNLEDSSSIMIQKFPKNIKKDLKMQEIFNLIQEAIVSIRRAKTLIDMGNSKIELAFIKLDEKVENEKSFDKELAKKYIQRLAKVEKLEFVSEKIKEKCLSDLSQNLEIYIPTASVDLSLVKEKLQKQDEKIEKEILKLNSMLTNEKFLARAPKELVKENKEALENAKNRQEKIERELSSLEI